MLRNHPLLFILPAPEQPRGRHTILFQGRFKSIAGKSCFVRRLSSIVRRQRFAKDQERLSLRPGGLDDGINLGEHSPRPTLIVARHDPHPTLGGKACLNS